MRRISVVLALAAIVLTVVVGYTYKLRRDKQSQQTVRPDPRVHPGDETYAPTGWKYAKDDPQTNKPVVRVNAGSFEATRDPSKFSLRDVMLRLYHKDADKYTFVRSGSALFDERSGVLTSDGPVTIVMNVPAEKNAENAAEVAGLVQVQTSGVTYETKSGKANTEKPATFKFAQGGGQGLGVSYDPAVGELHVKSGVALDWLGHGPPENKMHVEAGDLLYKEREQKIFLSPWSKLEHQGTTVEARDSVVLLDDGVLHEIDAQQATGFDEREDKRTDYSANTVRALFDDQGVLINLIADGDARVASVSDSSRTTMTSKRADLRFAVDNKTVNGQLVAESNLHLVLADGHAVAQSDPLPPPGQKTATADSHVLRSEHIMLQMKPDGKDVQEIDTPSQAELEFKPNRAEQPHRFLEASQLRILYGAGSYIDRVQAPNAATRTLKPPTAETKNPPPALTWSDQLTASFKAESNQVDTIEQTGHFRYQEGLRKATSSKAILEQTANRITLIDNARMSDENGSAVADKIVMNQANGDMDAFGRVASTRAPDKNQKPGTSVLDSTKTMEARADRMESRENSTHFVYEGHAAVWQGANRITAQRITIDRDEQTVDASGNVVSELVDGKSQNASGDAQAAGAPIFTTVYAPAMAYRDDVRRANYTGGVKLVRSAMTVTSKELQAFLNPQSQNGDSSLDHAFGEGDVKIVDTRLAGHTRTANSEHCEYYTKDDKVILNGGAPQLVDSVRGLTRGRQLTYFSDDDRLIVEGEDKNLAYTRMRKR